jgi:RimJ/RimL family protein N-acetyltransferase
MDQDVGEAVDWTPVRRPSRHVLAGATVRLEPIDAKAQGPALYEASHDPRAPELWEYLPVGPFPDEDSFTAWLVTAARSDDPLFFAVIDQETDRPSGMVSFMRMAPEHGVIEIGFIWFGPALQRTRQATEAIYLLARHAFDDLDYRRLEWKCNALNERSRQAALRFGFSYEGIFRQHMVVKGQNRDTAWFSIIDREWPDIRAAFETWLRPENFDTDGKQHQTLSAVREQISRGLNTPIHEGSGMNHLDANTALIIEGKAGE